MLIVVCLMNDYIKLILFVACIVISLHHHNWTLLSNVINDKKWMWNLTILLISCLYHLEHLCLMPLCSYVQSYFGKL